MWLRIANGPEIRNPISQLRARRRRQVIIWPASKATASAAQATARKRGSAAIHPGELAIGVNLGYGSAARGCASIAAD
jgi:uncharacterized protein with PIN domain